MNTDPYSIQIFPDASTIPYHCRTSIINLLNSIIAKNWKITAPHWSETHSPFQKRYALILALNEQKTIGFSVYRLLYINNIPVIYRSGTEILPEHQGQGLYRIITKEIIDQIFTEFSGDYIYYSWRTRNPIVWNFNAGFCVQLVPDFTKNENSINIKELESLLQNRKRALSWRNA